MRRIADRFTATTETQMSENVRDVEKGYTNAEFVSKLRRLADCIETGENFEIQVAGERIYVPARAAFSIEPERDEAGDAGEGIGDIEITDQCRHRRHFAERRHGADVLAARG